MMDDWYTAWERRQEELEEAKEAAREADWLRQQHVRGILSACKDKIDELEALLEQNGLYSDPRVAAELERIQRHIMLVYDKIYKRAPPEAWEG